jgi:hypothetical protein
MYALSSFNLYFHIYLSFLSVFPLRVHYAKRPHVSFCLLESTYSIFAHILWQYMSWHLMHVSMSFGSLIIIDHYDKCLFLYEYFMQGFEMFEACMPSDWYPGFADLSLVTVHEFMPRNNPLISVTNIIPVVSIVCSANRTFTHKYFVWAEWAVHKIAQSCC